jgi:hypothetical protein
MYEQIAFQRLLDAANVATKSVAEFCEWLTANCEHPNAFVSSSGGRRTLDVPRSSVPQLM